MTQVAAKSRGFARIVLIVGAMIATCGSAVAGPGYGSTDYLDGKKSPVMLESRPNAQVPLDAKFRNEEGQEVPLSTYFQSGKAVILVPVFYGCQSVCTNTLNEVVHGIGSGPRDLVIGRDYEIVTISIDPTETAELAKEKRKSYLKALGKPDLVGGWHFLTGRQEEIHKVTDAIGFFYAADPETRFDHLQALYVLTPSGRISSTVTTEKTYTEPKVSLYDHLVYASNGKIGSSVIKFLIGCGAMKYDPKSGRYVHNPWMWAATIGGLLSMITVGTFVGSLWVGEYKKAKLAKQKQASATPGTPAAGI